MPCSVLPFYIPTVFRLAVLLFALLGLAVHYHVFFFVLCSAFLSQVVASLACWCLAFIRFWPALLCYAHLSNAVLSSRLLSGSFSDLRLSVLTIHRPTVLCFAVLFLTVIDLAILGLAVAGLDVSNIVLFVVVLCLAILSLVVLGLGVLCLCSHSLDVISPAFCPSTHSYTFFSQTSYAEVSKTERCLQTCLNEQSTQLHTSAVAHHFLNCSYAQHIADFNVLNDNLNTSFHVSTDATNLIFSNCKIIRSCKSNNPNQSLILEALLKKLNKPEMNSGLEASKERSLFS